MPAIFMQPIAVLAGVGPRTPRPVGLAVRGAPSFVVPVSPGVIITYCAGYSFREREQSCGRIGLQPSASFSRGGVLGEPQEPSETALAMLGVPGLPGSVFRAPRPRRVHG